MIKNLFFQLNYGKNNIQFKILLKLHTFVTDIKMLWIF